MSSKIITKTDRQMEDRMLAVSSDPERADTLAKARAFKRSWLELAEVLARVDSAGSWSKWGYPDFDAYCRNELHLKSGTVAKLLSSYRFLKSSAPRIIDRAREDGGETTNIPSMAAVEFVQKAQQRGAADEEMLESIKHAAFDEGTEAPLLAKRFKEVAFPEAADDRKERLRQQIAVAARRLSSLIAEDGAPLTRKLAVQVEETLGELLIAIDSNN